MGSSRLNTRECDPGQRRHSLKDRTSIYHLLMLNGDSASTVQIFTLPGCVCVRGPNRGPIAPPSSPRRGLHMWVCPGGFFREGISLALPAHLFPLPPKKRDLWTCLPNTSSCDSTASGLVLDGSMSRGGPGGWRGWTG